jgi:aspartyl-tRNA(Asn)/glutamyl-tRNA(Gln) amidotransferase subunit C
MALEREEVLGIAELARLEIPEHEVEALRQQLSEVLEFVAALRRLDLEGCEPSVFAPEETPLRDDTLDERRLTPEAALSAAPEHDENFFLVPPIVEHLNP